MADVTLVLEKFNFTPELDKDEKLLEIEGRNSGIMGWILGQLGLNERSYIIITRRDVTFKFAGLSGITYIVAPLKALTCSLCGVEKPLWMLILGVLGILVGLYLQNSRGLYGPLAPLIALAIGGGLLYLYWRTKNLAVTFSTGDMGDVHGLAFQATTINGKVVDFNYLLEAIEHINALMVEVQTKDDK